MQFRETTVEFNACKYLFLLVFVSFGPRQQELRHLEFDRRAQGALSLPEMRPARRYENSNEEPDELDGTGRIRVQGHVELP